MKNAPRHCLALFGLLVLLQGCKKDETAAPSSVTYEKLGDVMVNGLTGFAANGDPIGSDGTSQAVRWNSAGKQWERLPATPTVNGTAPAVVGEDAAGNFYASAALGGNYVLPAGTTTWQPVPLPDTDQPLYLTSDPPFINTAGTVVMQSRRQTSAGARVRLYRKSAGASTWTRLLDRPADNGAIVQLADNGDVFMRNTIQTTSELLVLKANATTLVPVANCSGTVVLPYCSFQTGVSPAGDVVYFQGGTGSRQLYRMPAGAAYPATAAELYVLPDGTATFFDFAALSNGTCLGTANDGANGAFYLYLRTAQASGWLKAPDLPGVGYVYVRTNRQGQSFTASRQSASAKGSVYRINY